MAIGAFSSSSKTSVKTTSEAINTGFSEIAGQATSVNLSFAGVSVGKKAAFKPVINLSLTDQGALKTAVDISRASLSGIELLGGRLESAFGGAVGAIAAQNERAIQAVVEGQRTELENIGLAGIKWGALVGGAYFLARAVGAFR